ncbi:MAG: hypothetical protein LBP31_02050, partial [Holosporales bacterium]|nr:hypothetical protein [Holosporales bacterium]
LLYARINNKMYNAIIMNTEQYVDVVYQIAYSLPEIAVIVLILLNTFVIAIATTKVSNKIVPKISMFGTLAIAVIMLIYTSSSIKTNTWLFAYNYFSYQLKMFLILCIFFGIALLVVKNVHKILSTNIYITILCNVLALMISISTNNLLIMYIGLELYSISLYFLLAPKTGVKYIILSTIMSAVFLYGTSLYYLNLNSISFVFLSNFDLNFLGTIGIFLIFSYLLFKTNIAPFHTWSVELYDSSPLPLVLFLDSLAKFILFSILACFCSVLLLHRVACFQDFLMTISVISLFIGGIVPFLEKNIKKFIAYSSVGHTGFALIVLSVFEKNLEIKHAIIYVFSYFLSSFCLFIGLIGIEKHKNIKYFDELRGAIKVYPTYLYAVLCGLLSMVGLPPFIGFVAKLNVFYMLAEHGRYWLIAAVSVYTMLTVAYTVSVIKHIFMKSEEKLDEVNTKINFLHVLSVAAILSIVVGSLVFQGIESRVENMVKSLEYNNEKPANLRLLNILMSNENIKELHNSLLSSISNKP